MSVRVQRDDFDVGAELAALGAGNKRIGAITSFVGLVRDMHVREGHHRDAVSALTLEHYPGMTETALQEIEAEANRRWPLEASLIVHRYGRLEPGERIVLVAVASPHREAAFEACHFLIDWLKTKAPFWKVEDTPRGEQWVGAHGADDEAARKWER
jgi:molybdopterin synthase catalytic subunit